MQTDMRSSCQILFVATLCFPVFLCECDHWAPSHAEERERDVSQIQADDPNFPIQVENYFLWTLGPERFNYSKAQQLFPNYKKVTKNIQCGSGWAELHQPCRYRYIEWSE